MTSSDAEHLDASLRSRKKQRTRQEIADAALLLFATHGFDAVTIAEIARAAEVSDQTVYNYFKTKESLVFDEDEAFEARFVAMVRDRPETQSLLEAVRAQVHAFLDGLSHRPTGVQHRGSMPYLVATSAPLRRHWLAVAERHGRAVAEALVADSKGALSLTEAKVLATSLVGVFAVIIDEIGQTMTSDGDVVARIKTLRHEIDSALERMAHDFNVSGGGQA
ncbi:MAG TPA: TetR/AcrR family transcriptional regulator [Steroidobacteraceae bacterium]|nr:TetR/AcrR family transcriptional regulator [Steroidobacteraceae bacterium]